MATAKVFDRVWDTTTTTGTGTLTLANAPPFAYRSFGAVLATGDTCFYLAAHQLDGSWEVGVGTYNNAGPTLARTTLLASSTGSAINFASGTIDVMIVNPAGRTFDSTFGVDVPGAIKPFAGLTVPAGYLFCDGSAVSRTTYGNLYSALSNTQLATLNATTTVTGMTDTSMLGPGMTVSGSGIPTGTTIATIASATSITLSAAAAISGTSSLVFTAWGNGDGSSTFNLPDLRGRSLIGSGAGTGLTSRILGATGGEETHKLTVAEMPSHTHEMTYYALSLASGSAKHQTFSGGTTGNLTEATGGDGSHNNMHPFATVQYIIKT